MSVEASSALEGGEEVALSGTPGARRGGEQDAVERAAARVVAQVDQVVDPPHRLTEQRSRARLGGRMVAAGEGLDDLEGEHRREAGALDRAARARSASAEPDDGVPLGLERGAAAARPARGGSCEPAPSSG